MKMKPAEKSTDRALNTYTKLMRAAESVTVRTSRHMTAAGLTISQFGVLEALLHKGPLCQRDIATKILKSTGNITMVIDNLEKRGLVRRERDNQDRRYLTVHLSATGRVLVSRVFAGVESSIVTELAVLSGDEQGQLGALCKKLGLQPGTASPVRQI
jgi:MarR family 2-MHQ and catechol resistance regulon transcriptional repressor